MSYPTEEGPTSSASPAEYNEIIVKRDGNRPISFCGKILAKVSMSARLSSWSMTAALYETRGGKFVSALSKKDSIMAAVHDLQDPDAAPSGEFNKAQVFDNFESAVAWFRPGRLTDALRKQLGLDEPERID